MDNTVELPLTDEVRTLALSVIALAVSDFRKHPNYATYQFLTGQTEISEFWWSVAELQPLSGTTSMEEVKRLLRNNNSRGGEQLRKGGTYRGSEED